MILLIANMSSGSLILNYMNSSPHAFDGSDFHLLSNKIRGQLSRISTHGITAHRMPRRTL